MPSSASRRQPPTSHPSPPDSATTSASASSRAVQFTASSITLPLPLQQVASALVAAQAPAHRRQALADIVPGHTASRLWLRATRQNDAAGLSALAPAPSQQANILRQ